MNAQINLLRFAVVCLLAVSVCPAEAAAPPLINYRGYLADRPGNQSAEIRFAVYGQQEGGTALWEETQPVDLFDGNFAVLLGNATPIPVSLFDEANRYLAVQVTGEDELVPRQQLVSVPYAFRSEVASSAVSATDAQTLGGIPASGFIQASGGGWLPRLGVASTAPDRSPANLMEINVAAGDSNIAGLTIQGAPSGGDMGIRLNNTGTGGRSWFIDSSNNGSSNMGGGKLSFLHFESNIFINPNSEEQSRQSQPQDVDESQIIIQPTIRPIPTVIIPTTRWVDVLVLDGNNNRVGILTESPQQTLDVRGTIGNAGTTYHSDARWKKNVQTLDHALDKVLRMRGVTYEWNRRDYGEMNFAAGPQVGLIAQEVEAVEPELVATGDDGYKSVDYARMVPLLIESIKEQQAQIEELRNELARLRTQ